MSGLSNESYVLVFAGGEYPPPGRAAPVLNALGSSPQAVLGADSGLEGALVYGRFFGFGLDLVIGDMDSAPPSLLASLPRSKLEVHPRDKDDTDTVLALKRARALAAGPNGGTVVLVGGAGGRLDHALGIHGILGEDFSPDLWLTGEQAVWVLGKGRPGLEVSGLRRDDPVSVFPARGARRLRAEGLRWPLGGLDWAAGAFSLSNEIDPRHGQGPVGFHAEEGAFAVFLPLEERIHARPIKAAL
ncbi:MAG: thiamine diphosphokinase [Spirochaetaceae bacterium]|jgi:thiamine pyrophosphokinase|nr:thiamine diphosphokinase [Spirochaetaceae bacterium]